MCPSELLINWRAIMYVIVVTLCFPYIVLFPLTVAVVRDGGKGKVRSACTQPVSQTFIWHLLWRCVKRFYLEPIVRVLVRKPWGEIRCFYVSLTAAFSPNMFCHATISQIPLDYKIISHILLLHSLSFNVLPNYYLFSEVLRKYCLSLFEGLPTYLFVLLWSSSQILLVHPHYSIQTSLLASLLASLLTSLLTSCL